MKLRRRIKNTKKKEAVEKMKKEMCDQKEQIQTVKAQNQRLEQERLVDEQEMRHQKEQIRSVQKQNQKLEDDRQADRERYENQLWRLERDCDSVKNENKSLNNKLEDQQRKHSLQLKVFENKLKGKMLNLFLCLKRRINLNWEY